jgi:hypothetical protein
MDRVAPGPTRVQTIIMNIYYYVYSSVNNERIEKYYYYHIRLLANVYHFEKNFLIYLPQLASGRQLPPALTSYSTSSTAHGAKNYLQFESG